jgi:hypothetical protein
MILGFEVLSGYPPSRLLGFSAVSLLFVIALQLREIKKVLNSKNSDQKKVVGYKRKAKRS